MMRLYGLIIVGFCLYMLNGYLDGKEYNLENIFQALFGGWIFAVGLFIGIGMLLGNITKESIEENEKIKRDKELEEHKEAYETFQNIAASVANDNITSNNNNNTTQNIKQTPKQKVRDGILVKYRIKTIGTDQSEVVQSNSESEARRIIKAKYPTMDVHIISTTYNYK